jgi:hypothetical protein
MLWRQPLCGQQQVVEEESVLEEKAMHVAVVVCCKINKSSTPLPTVSV